MKIERQPETDREKRREEEGGDSFVQLMFAYTKSVRYFVEQLLN